MKLLTYSIDGKASWGAVKDHGVVDLGKRTAFASIREVLAANALPSLAALVTQNAPDHSLNSITYLPVIPNPDKIFCAGVNYHDHRIEVGRDETEQPTIFARFANSQLGHGQAILRPPESEQLDFEGEIAIVISKRARRVKQADAWKYIAGYAPYCDGTIRDFQRHTTQWISGKNFFRTGGFGPWMVTRDEIADGANLTLVTRLNGVEVQNSCTDLLIFSIPKLIEYCSTFTELEAGDVIVTGTPGGVGAKRKPPLWMKEGDTLEIEVGSVGTLCHPIKNE